MNATLVGEMSALDGSISPMVASPSLAQQYAVGHGRLARSRRVSQPQGGTWFGLPNRVTNAVCAVLCLWWAVGSNHAGRGCNRVRESSKQWDVGTM